MMALLSLSAEVALGLLSPARCSACDVRIPMKRAFCASCASSVERASSARAAFVYGGAMTAAIARFKYAGRAELGSTLGALLAQMVPREAFDFVAPVPLHPKRLVERGYNQAALLAAPVAVALRAEFAPRLLRRKKATATQAKLNRAARRQNVAGAFVARSPKDLVGAKVLLVDDVRTTGATLDACVQTLREAGVTYVQTAVLAEAEVHAGLMYSHRA